MQVWLSPKLKTGQNVRENNSSTTMDCQVNRARLLVMIQTEWLQFRKKKTALYKA